jgi:hypothetical protein
MMDNVKKVCYFEKKFMPAPEVISRITAKLSKSVNE